MKAYLQAYDRVNLGDDLFVRFLVKRYPGVRFYMVSDKENADVFRDLKNLRIIDKDNKLARFLAKIRPSFASRYWALIRKSCRCMIYIGGSIFIEYPNWKMVSEAWHYHCTHNDYYVLGANFGPFYTPEYAQTMKSIFAEMKDICFRDRYSYELFADLPGVRLAPDILFAQPFPNGVKEKKQVFVSAIDCRDEANGLSGVAEKYEGVLVSTIKSCLDGGYDVTLASFCRAEGDEKVCDCLRDALAKDGYSVQRMNYDGTNSEAMLHEIAGSEYVIGTRFHATVLGLAAGKKVLPIIYSDKTKNMLEDIGFNGTRIDLREPFAPVTLEDLQNSTHQNDLGQISKKALNHFRGLDELFEG